MEEEQPGLYRHPSPFSTNAHWDADRLLGPIPKRGKKKSQQTESQRAMRSVGVASSTGGSNIASTVTLEAGNMSPDHEDNDKWNRRLYQRQDEELWGTVLVDDGQRSGNGCLPGSTPLSRPTTARTTDSSQSYHSKRNPAINDLHPPTVTRVQSRDDVAWMLQPPPVAAVMHGSEKPTRSRSNSGSSRPSARDSSHALSRQVSERIMLQKLKSSETLAPAMSRTSSGGTALTGAGQRHDRSSPPLPMPDTGESSADEFPSKKKERRRPKPLKISEEDSSGSAVTVVRRPNGLPAESNPSTYKHLKVVSRPQLATIRSDDLNAAETSRPGIIDMSNRSSSSSDLEWRHRAARRPPLHVNGDSLQGLQELILPSRTRNNKINPPTLLPSPTIVKASTTTNPVLEARLHVRQQQPKPSSKETVMQQQQTRRSLSSNDDEEEVLPPFEALLARDLDLHGWIEEHTRREVQQRWSMDI